MQNQQTMILKSTFKAKVGIFFGYNGESFKGMQYQRQHQNTIQNLMHKILFDGGFILKSNADQLKKIKWSRAARTDKRVHALCNGISVKLQIGQKFKLNQNTKQINFQKIIQYLNTELPMDVRVFAIKKVTKSFDMRHDALTRVYNYIAPIYLFQAYEKFKEEIIPNQQQQNKIIENLNLLCSKYLGTHNFHNFTKGYKQNDPRCDRYMISMKAQKVQPDVINRYWEQHKEGQIKRIQKHQGFVRFTLVGQSFIYHQIRKMIGLLIKISSQQLNGEETIQNAFKKDKVDMFLAPGQGLYLNKMTFENYNKKHLPFQRVELSQQQQRKVLKFRQYLQSKILNHQIEHKVFSIWLQNRIQAKYEDEAKSQDSEQVQSQEKES